MSRMHSLDVEPMGNNRIGMVQTLPSYVYYIQPTDIPGAVREAAKREADRIRQ